MDLVACDSIGRIVCKSRLWEASRLVRIPSKMVSNPTIRFIFLNTITREVIVLFTLIIVQEEYAMVDHLPSKRLNYGLTWHSLILFCLREAAETLSRREPVETYQYSRLYIRYVRWLCVTAKISDDRHRTSFLAIQK